MLIACTNVEKQPTIAGISLADLLSMSAYLFKSSDGIRYNTGYNFAEETEVLFAVTVLILSNTDSELTIPKQFQRVSKILNQLKQISYHHNKCLVHTSIRNSTKRQIIEVSSIPESLIPLSILFAAQGTEADITGLDEWSTGEKARFITMLQRLLYRLNVNTDFCGGSKFKIYNNKTMNPNNSIISVPDEHFPLWLILPLVKRTGSLKLVINHQMMIERSGLLSAAGISSTAINE